MENTFFIEKLYGNSWQQRLEIKKLLFEKDSKYQNIKIFENPVFGKVLAIDNVLQTTENDEFIYHEMLTHVPILSHGNVKKVLIIGGGDGGMLREALRHKSIEKVVMVEIDGEVIEACKEHMPKISNNAFEDLRSEVIVGDGIAYVKNTPEKFDVIIVDSTDPIGPGMVLFTKEFYQHCKNALNADGILVTQNGVPFSQSTELKETHQNRKAIFKDNRFFLAPVFGYIGGFMAFGWATDNEAHFEISLNELEDRLNALNLDMRYYTPSVHKASFALPKYIENLIA